MWSSCSSPYKCALPASASWSEQWKLEPCLHVLDVGRKPRFWAQVHMQWGFCLFSDCGDLALVLIDVNQAWPPRHGMPCLAPCKTSSLGSLCQSVGRSGELAPSGGDYSMSISSSAEHASHKS